MKYETEGERHMMEDAAHTHKGEQAKEPDTTTH
jgi:hypothetical protein